MNELKETISAARRTFIAVAIMSGAINVLYLTGSFYMLQVYDRVVPSRSVATLIGISIMALLLYLTQGMLDMTRNRILSRVGSTLDARLSWRIFGLVSRLPLMRVEAAAASQPLRDLDQVRSFISGSGPNAFFDLPWLPIYLVICFLFHYLVGFTVLLGVFLLSGMALLTEVASRGPAAKASKAAGLRHAQIEATRSNAEIVKALGMNGSMMDRWMKVTEDYRDANQKASDAIATFGGLAKVSRMILQSGVLALGAWLVIHQEATGGIIIASSILSARAFAPVELAIANWKGFVAARQSWKRLNETLSKIPEEAALTKLPKPTRKLSTESLFMRFPGQEKFILSDVSFELEAGHAIGVIGPSASGKSTLARIVTGVWPPERGKVCLDGAAINQFSSADLGQYIGYLPQSVELFSGTIAENISRFLADAKDEDIIAAAKAAGVHEMILEFPKGYNSEVGEAGCILSAGQRQRIGLARALYGWPFLVVLDEPNSNLDSAGETALTAAIKQVCEKGGSVLVIAHRPSALAACDRVMVLANGRIHQIGPKDEVLNAVLKVPPRNAPPASPIASAAGPLGGMTMNIVPAQLKGINVEPTNVAASASAQSRRAPAARNHTLDKAEASKNGEGVQAVTLTQAYGAHLDQQWLVGGNEGGPRTSLSPAEQTQKPVIPKN